jgi:Mg2+ and Co2+ transporter CorA
VAPPAIACTIVDDYQPVIAGLQRDVDEIEDEVFCGMNFEQMPELGWTFGYPFALAMMVLISVGLYVVFKRRHWKDPTRRRDPRLPARECACVRALFARSVVC